MRVARELDRIVAERGRPQTIVSDNGTEFTSNAILRWADESRVGWHLHRARQANAERLFRKLQRPAARRTLERDAVPVASAYARRARRMADGLQHHAPALASRLAHAGRLRPHLPAASAGAAQPSKLRPVARRSTGPCGQTKQSDSGSGWIKVGGNVMATGRWQHLARICSSHLRARSVFGSSPRLLRPVGS